MGVQMTHVALHVSAIDACIEFYQRYCNLEITADQERGGRRMVLMAKPGQGRNLVLQLIGGGRDMAPTPEEDQHFGFAVDSREELDRLAAMAADDDILLFEIFEAPFPVGCIFGVKDPNGNTIEFGFDHLIR